MIIVSSPPSSAPGVLAFRDKKFDGFTLVQLEDTVAAKHLDEHSELYCGRKRVAATGHPEVADAAVLVTLRIQPGQHKKITYDFVPEFGEHVLHVEPTDLSNL